MPKCSSEGGKVKEHDFHTNSLHNCILGNDLISSKVANLLLTKKLGVKNTDCLLYQ